MTTAFQGNAFQSNAFQIEGGVTGDVDYFLEIDPATYIITNAGIEFFYSGAIGFAGGRRGNYIVKGKRYYNLTNEELVYLIARELIEPARMDIKVSYKNKKPHIIPKTAWDSLQETLKSIESRIPASMPDNDDEEAILLLL